MSDVREFDGPLVRFKCDDAFGCGTVFYVRERDFGRVFDLPWGDKPRSSTCPLCDLSAGPSERP